MTGPGEVRASDADREETAAALGAHWTDGRLDEAELDRRVSAAYAAVTRGERAFDQAPSTIVPGLGAAGYHLVESQRPERMHFEMRGALRSGLPLTLLFLPGEGGGCRIVAFGEAPRGVRKGLAELRD